MNSIVIPSEYVQTADIVRIVRICQTAGSVVILYDHFINMDREVNHVWNQPFSFGSINYMLIRYLGDILAILNLTAFLEVRTQQVRVVYFFFQSWLGIFVLFLIQATLQVRLYALYHGSAKILALMVFGFVGEIAAMVTIMGLVDAYSQVTNEVRPGLFICANTRGPSFFQPYVIWLPVVAYDGVLCLLAACRGIRSWISGYRARRFDGVRITDVLVKDNVGYFLCILLICIISVILAQSLGIVWMEVSEEFPAPMEVVIGCRLILSLRSSLVQDREDYNRIRDDAPWIAARPLSTMKDHR